MTALLTELGGVVTAVFGYVGDAVGIIVETPLLLMSSGIFLAGAAVSLLSRFGRS